MKIKLLKLTTTKTLSAFTLSFNNVKKVYLTNTEESDLFWITEQIEKDDSHAIETCKYNKNSLYNVDLSAVYYPMYDSKLPYYKSAIYKKGKSVRDGNTYDFQDITNHKLSSELLDICHVDNIMYALEPKSAYGRYDLSCDIWSWLSVDHGHAEVPLKRIKTVTYKRNKLQLLLLNNEDLSKHADEIVNLSSTGVLYNTIYEINGNIYNDYEGGSIAANVFKAKNLYNSTYDMLYKSNTAFLRNTRNYTAIDSCNKTLYLKYNDSYNYPLTSSIEPVAENRNNNLNNKYGFSYPNIEVIKSINRYENFSAHKTNLYSIIVKTDLLHKVRLNILHYIDLHKSETAYATINKRDVETYINKILDNICLEIANGVKAIAKQLLPAHTLLYSVHIKNFYNL